MLHVKLTEANEPCKKRERERERERERGGRGGLERGNATMIQGKERNERAGANSKS